MRNLANVTVTLDESTLAKARVKAAERNVSLSRYVGEVLREFLGKEDGYWKAYRAWKDEKPLDLKGPWKPYPRREELYDRPVLRRR
jgi:hypothetical protein